MLHLSNLYGRIKLDGQQMQYFLKQKNNLLTHF